MIIKRYPDEARAAIDCTLLSDHNIPHQLHGSGLLLTEVAATFDHVVELHVPDPWVERANQLLSPDQRT